MNLMLLPLLAGAWTKLAQLVVDHQMESDDGMRKFTRRTDNMQPASHLPSEGLSAAPATQCEVQHAQNCGKTTDSCASTAPATENGTTRSAL